MKILEIIPQLSSGGGERFVVDLCNELSKEHDVTLMVLHSLDKVDFYLKEVSNNVRVVSMNKRMGLDIGLLFRVYRYIRREKPDVVHTHLCIFLSQSCERMALCTVIQYIPLLIKKPEAPLSAAECGSSVFIVGGLHPSPFPPNHYIASENIMEWMLL
jgi:hypothetical protein